jgi:hypothetical protein
MNIRYDHLVFFHMFGLLKIMYHEGKNASGVPARLNIPPFTVPYHHIFVHDFLIFNEEIVRRRHVA